MKLAVICFTACAARLSSAILNGLSDLGCQCSGWTLKRLIRENAGDDRWKPLDTSLHEWTEEQFYINDGLIFIGAAGIAVRAIAPFIKSKTEDPAVVVIDEQGRFAIPLLSGHIGGANQLAVQLSHITGAVPVITTATDINGIFAVDVFAKERGLAISDMKLAKAVSSDLLEGRLVGFYSDFQVEGRLPDGLTDNGICRQNIWVTVKDSPASHLLSGADNILRLIPGIVVLGIGCRKGIPQTHIAKVVFEILKKYRIDFRAVSLIASIDLKKEENGLCDFAKNNHIKFKTFPAEALQLIAGDFTKSEFVRQTTGVDNVCERAALAGCLGGQLIIKKHAGDGVTVAAAIKDWKVQI